MSADVKVFAPATVANVGCAFDVLGFAVQAPGDELVLKKNNGPYQRFLPKYTKT